MNSQVLVYRLLQVHREHALDVHFFNKMVLTANLRAMAIIIAVELVYFLLHQIERGSTIRYGYKNEELVHECFPKHPRMGTARMK